jgi:hypothetical protein
MKFKKLIIALFLLILIGNAIAFLPRKASRSSFKALGQMSSEERDYLATFLHILLFSDNFAYLLFGSKPIAIAGFEKLSRFTISHDYRSALNLKIIKGFELLKKNQYLFSCSNIIVYFDEDESNLFILMINKKNLLKTLEESIDDFRQVLGSETTVKSLFTRIIGGEEYLADVIKNHEALLGILLGYGRNNAWLFHEYGTICRRLSRFEPPMKGDSLLEKRFNEINQKTGGFSEDFQECKYILKSPYISLPHFMADFNSLETKKLKESYEKERENMKKLFAKQNYVEATLLKLMDE